MGTILPVLREKAGGEGVSDKKPCIWVLDDRHEVKYYRTSCISNVLVVPNANHAVCVKCGRPIQYVEVKK